MALEYQHQLLDNYDEGYLTLNSEDVRRQMSA